MIDFVWDIDLPIQVDVRGTKPDSFKQIHFSTIMVFLS